MLKLAFDIYPVGHFCFIPAERRYRAGKRLVGLFLERGILADGEYSVLLYDTDRVKLEIQSNRVSSEVDFKTILHAEEEALTIVCWESVEPDSNDEDLKLKLLGTSLRENVPEGDPFHHSLCRGNYAGWINLIQALTAKQRATPNPGATLIDVLKVWQHKIQAMGGVTNGRLHTLIHFVLNPLGYEAENYIRSRC